MRALCNGTDPDAMLISGHVPGNLREVFAQAKSPDRQSEDIIVVSEDYLAVIDGMSSPLREAQEVASGRSYAAALACAITDLPGHLDATNALNELSAAVAHLSPGHRGPAGAVIAMYSRSRQEVWRVGDVHVRIGNEVYQGRKAVDEALAACRAVINQAYLASGVDLDTIIREDPGLAGCASLLEAQPALANTTGRFGYGVVNGGPIPVEHIERWAVPAGSTVVLASDGYLTPARSWDHAEAALAEAIACDPAALAELTEMAKPLLPGASAPDDRSYLRFESPTHVTDTQCKDNE